MERNSLATKPLREGGLAARIAVIPGDGIGKEVTPEAIKAIRAVIDSRSNVAGSNIETSARRQIEFVEFAELIIVD